MANDHLPASVQFFDNLSTIKEMKERRFPIKRIWQSLHDEGKYTGDYTHFCRLAKKEFDTALPTSNNLKQSTQQQSTQNKKQECSKNPPKKEDADTQEDDGPLMFMGDLSQPKK